MLRLTNEQRKTLAGWLDVHTERHAALRKQCDHPGEAPCGWCRWYYRRQQYLRRSYVRH